jgi:hypothetical protein
VTRFIARSSAAASNSGSPSFARVCAQPPVAKATLAGGCDVMRTIRATSARAASSSSAVGGSCSKCFSARRAGRIVPWVDAACRAFTATPWESGIKVWFVRAVAGIPCSMSDASDPGDHPATDDADAFVAPVESPARLSPERGADDPPQGMLPARERRRTVVERGFVRIVATGGVIGIATILGAVLVSQNVAGWIVGLVVGLTSVILAAVLWSSRQL